MFCMWNKNVQDRKNLKFETENNRIFYELVFPNYSMNTAPFWRSKTCIDCKRIKCQTGCNCDCHWQRWR